MTEFSGARYQDIVCILGMHRSGTSLLTRMLNLMGVYLGPEQLLMKPNSFNPSGYWEHEEIVSLNDDLLERFGGSWNEPPTFPLDWEDSPLIDDLKERARRLIHDSFGDAEIWGWKDPRSSLTLPFWQQVLTNIRYIICLRNPVDVAYSLERRDSLSAERSSSLWFAYVNSALKHSEGRPRLVIFYEDLMEDCLRELQRVADFLGKPERAAQADVQEAVHDFTEKEFQHYDTSIEQVAVTSRIALRARALYIAQRISVGFGRNEDNGPQDLDHQTEKALDILSRYSLNASGEANPLIERLTELENQLVVCRRNGQTTFNPLTHPISLNYPLRISPSAWLGHVPFGFYLIDVLRPKAIAELGTHYGVSYCAFCQAVKELGLETRCYAVDSWQGDAHAGFYGTEVLKDLEEYHNPLYGGFSQLIQATFEEALSSFADDSLDLLHIDGFHTYEAVKQDFEKWLPKLTDRGVVLLHDIGVRESDFGVWKFWEELKKRFPHFEFTHSHGLGVVAVGPRYSDELNELFQCSMEEATRIRSFFAYLGQGLEAAQGLIETQKTLRSHDEAITWLKAQADELENVILRRDEAIVWQREKVEELENVILARDEAIAWLKGKVEELENVTRGREEAIAWLKPQVDMGRSD